MPEFVKICAKGELPPPGEACEMSAAGKMLCVANDGGEISILDNVCPHREGPLGQGMIENGKLLCPWHAWAFDLKTGQVEHIPQQKVEMYEVKIEDEDVLVKI